MKARSFKELVVFMCLLISVFGSAHTKKSTCLIRNEILESTSQYPVSNCVQGEPLELNWKDSRAPDENYWAGSWQKEILEIKKYIQIIDDICLSKRVSQKEFEVKKNYIQIFSIANPRSQSNSLPANLLIPMAREEAEVQFLKAKEDCENSLSL